MALSVSVSLVGFFLRDLYPQPLPLAPPPPFDDDIILFDSSSNSFKYVEMTVATL
jgi:hypothetical protein